MHLDYINRAAVSWLLAVLMLTANLVSSTPSPGESLALQTTTSELEEPVTSLPTVPNDAVTSGPSPSLSSTSAVTSFSEPPPSSSWLSVRLVRVESDAVFLEWSSHPPFVRQQFITCQARYGLLTPDKILQQQENEDDFGRYWRFKQTQVEVLDNFVPDSPSFRLANLLPNTSYVFAMMCRSASAAGQLSDDGKTDSSSAAVPPAVTSNPIFFTTSLTNGNNNGATETRRQSVQLPVGNPSRYFASSTSTLINEWDDHLEPVRWSSKLSYRSQKTASYSIGLGIVCGLVGFLIINVTVVMAVRRYSSWHSRQSRIRQLRFIYGDSAERYYDVT